MAIVVLFLDFRKEISEERFYSLFNGDAIKVRDHIRKFVKREFGMNINPEDIAVHDVYLDEISDKCLDCCMSEVCDSIRASFCSCNYED
jgi:hypothetical protein